MTDGMALHIFCDLDSENNVEIFVGFQILRFADYKEGYLCTYCSG